MQNALTLLTAVHAKILAIPEVTEDLGEENILLLGDDALGEYISLADAIKNLLPPQMLIGHVGSYWGLRGRVTRWKHQFGIWINVEEQTQAYAVWSHIINGTPTGDSVQFEELELHPSCDPPEEFQGLMRVASGSGDEIFHGLFTLTESGG